MDLRRRATYPGADNYNGTIKNTVHKEAELPEVSQSVPRMRNEFSGTLMSSACQDVAFCSTSPLPEVSLGSYQSPGGGARDARDPFSGGSVKMMRTPTPPITFEIPKATKVHPNYNSEYIGRTHGILSESDLSYLQEKKEALLALKAPTKWSRKSTPRLSRSVLVFPVDELSVTIIALHEGKSFDVMPGILRSDIYNDEAYSDHTRIAGAGSQADVKFGQHYLLGSTGELTVGNRCAVKIYHRGQTPKEKELAIASEFGMLDHHAVIRSKHYVVSTLFTTPDLISQFIGDTYSLTKERCLMGCQSLVKNYYDVFKKGYYDSDLKGENMILEEDGAVKLFDFGGFRNVSQSGNGGAVCTMLFLAPEEDFKKTTIEGSIWRIGLALCMISGVSDMYTCPEGEKISFEQASELTELAGESLSDLFGETAIKRRLVSIIKACLTATAETRISFEKLQKKMSSLEGSIDFKEVATEAIVVAEERFDSKVSTGGAAKNPGLETIGACSSTGLEQLKSLIEGFGEELFESWDELESEKESISLEDINLLLTDPDYDAFKDLLNNLTSNFE